MLIREAAEKDLQNVLSIVRAAFEASREAEEVAQLVTDALSDSTAEPRLSLLAFVSDVPVGYILFTKAQLTTHPNLDVALLAPLAVVPSSQKQGIGRNLVEEGAKRLAQQGVELVFVSGIPTYYPRCGFQCAYPFGFEPPYPDEHPDAWMVRELHPGGIAKHSPGKLMCAKSIDRPEYWRGPPQD